MGSNHLDRLVQDYGASCGAFDWMYVEYNPQYLKEYPPDLARALAAELGAEAEEAFEREQEAAKKTPPSTHSDE